MIKRIVRMDILAGQEARFLDIFEGVKREIRTQHGCFGLEVLSSRQDGQVSIWTISLWASETDLNAYRNSDLFKATWSSVKPLFTTKAQAWTLTPIEDIA